MSVKPSRLSAAEMLAAHKLAEQPVLYMMGSFDGRVTVLAQQTRALNLAWAMVETDTVPTASARPFRVAVVGAGFAGLTFAAGLLRKGVKANIDIFEQRDSLLPLQQGSDTRWLHPNIYDWPAAGSEAAAAMLPVLNWTAARSSDVVVQVLGEWSSIVGDAEHVRLFCNTRHLQISESTVPDRRSRIEWVGEMRDSRDGRASPTSTTSGSSEVYDVIVLAVGFGLEAGEPSYWRNETLGQPGLNEAQRTYLLSGQGDGAMIDLLRIRVSQFRQDRILDELFAGRTELVERLRGLRQQFIEDEKGLFQKFEALSCAGSGVEDDLKTVMSELNRRLRRDTDVVLKLLVRNVAELLEPANSRMSFQNALLVYLLYRCGGFRPSNEAERALVARFDISKDKRITRHGVKPLAEIGKALPPELLEKITARRELDERSFGLQPAVSHWPGGYFGFEGPLAGAGNVGNEARRRWRKEYLPGPTALLATTLCGAISGVISRMRPDAAHYRVTLHRTLSLNDEELLQQACDYVGVGLQDSSATAGRTIVATALTIGAAYRTRRIVRSPRASSRAAIKDGMEKLQLHSVAREMKEDVSYVFAMPIVQPSTQYFAPNPVAVVLYMDSRDDDFWLEDGEIAELSLIAQSAIRAMDAADGAILARMRNFPLDQVCDSCSPAEKCTGTTALEILETVDPPSTIDEFVLNYDHTDLAPVSTKSTTLDA